MSLANLVLSEFASPEFLVSNKEIGGPAFDVRGPTALSGGGIGH